MALHETVAEGLYIRGLNLYMDGQKEEALNTLIECAKSDSEKVDAFYQAGNIFRELGRAEKAERIHRELLMRPSLSADKRKRVQLALMRDLIVQKKYKQAEGVIGEIQGGTKDALVIEETLRVYEASQEWEKALTALSDLEKIKGKQEPRFEYYCLELGKSLMASDGHAARLKFKEALKRNPESPWPFVLISDSYFDAGRVDDALKYWSEFFDKQPKRAYLLFDRIEKFYFDNGSYHEVGNIYRELLEREPNNINAMLSLASYQAKRGEKEEAVALCRKTLEINPSSREAQVELLRQLLDLSTSYEEIKGIVKEMLQLLSAKQRYRCKSCGSRTETPSWRCENCGVWSPYEV